MCMLCFYVWVFHRNIYVIPSINDYLIKNQPKFHTSNIVYVRETHFFFIFSKYLPVSLFHIVVFFLLECMLFVWLLTDNLRIQQSSTNYYVCVWRKSGLSEFGQYSIQKYVPGPWSKSIVINYLNFSMCLVYYCVIVNAKKNRILWENWDVPLIDSFNA